jgi:hypothetical protein
VLKLQLLGEQEAYDLGLTASALCLMASALLCCKQIVDADGLKVGLQESGIGKGVDAGNHVEVGVLVQLYIEGMELEEMHAAISGFPFGNGNALLFGEGQLLHFIQAAKFMDVHSLQ